MALVSVCPETASHPVGAGRDSSNQKKDHQRNGCLESGAGSGLDEMDLGSVVSKLKGICGDNSASNLDKGPNSKHTVNKSLFGVRANCTN